MDKVDASLSLAAFLGVVVFGVLQGIVVTIVLSLLAFIIRSWRPYRAELGRVPGRRGYHDLSRNPQGSRIPGIVIVRFDAPLFFANGATFDDWVRSRVGKARPGVHSVILASEPITDIDTTAIDELVELDDYLAAHGIRLLFAEMKGPVKDVLRQYGMTDRFTPDRFFSTVGAAVDELTGTVRGDLEGTKWDDDPRRAASAVTAEPLEPALSRACARRARRARRGAGCRPRARHPRCDRRADRGGAGRGRRCGSTGSRP